MRVALFGVGFMIAVWLGAAAWREANPPVVPPPAVAARQLHDCRDQCEQQAIVEQADEAWVRACQSRCRGDAAPAVREPIQRITVAPVDHRTTILDERRKR